MAQFFNPITSHVYTADIASSTVSVIDTASNSVLATIQIIILHVNLLLIQSAITSIPPMYIQTHYQ